MKTINLNHGWQFEDLTNKTTAVVDLPHDATIGTKRTTDDHTYFLNPHATHLAPP